MPIIVTKKKKNVRSLKIIFHNVNDNTNIW